MPSALPGLNISHEPLKATPLLYYEAIQFCRRSTQSILWIPHSISDFENDKILKLLRSFSKSLITLHGLALNYSKFSDFHHPDFPNSGTLLFWTGMEKFNSTHFTYGMDDHLNYFLPSKYFNSTRIEFKPVVTHHVPLLNLQVCPEIVEVYRKGQYLKNVQAEDGS